jgi:hypothetical protein
LDDKIDVSRFHVGLLVGLSAEDYLLLVLHALLDKDLEDLAFSLSLELVALSRALDAPALDLLDHAQCDLAELELDTPSVALVTNLGFADHDLAGDGELDGLAIVQVLQGNLEGVVDVFSASGTRASSPAATTTKEHAKEVLFASSSAALFESLEAVFVVFGAFFRVAQNFIGCRCNDI